MNTKSASFKLTAAVAVGIGFSFFGCINNPLSSNEGSKSISQQEDRPVIGAAAAPKTIKLTITTDGHGVTNPCGTVAAKANALYWVSSAPKLGWEFSKWIVTAGTATFATPTIDVTQVQLGTGNVTIKATYYALNPAVYKVYAKSSGPGSVLAAGTWYTNIGQTIHILATQKKGHVFTGWTVQSGKVAFANAALAGTTMKLVSAGGATIVANFK